MEMIAEYKNIHKGKIFAVVAAGPSALLYKGKEDVAIAVNGGIFVNRKIDYAMCGDIKSPQREWFNCPVGCTRIRASFISIYDRTMYPADIYNLAALMDLPGETNIKDFCPPRPVAPHFYYRYCMLSEVKKIGDQERLAYGTTISGVALQLAIVMGAEEIHLYGCGFTQESSYKAGHYFYDADKSQTGFIQENQIKNMDGLIQKVSGDVGIYVHGESRLTKGLKV